MKKANKELLSYLCYYFIAPLILIIFFGAIGLSTEITLKSASIVFWYVIPAIAILLLVIMRIKKR